MPLRQTLHDRKLPRIWLMTDPRLDDCLLRAVQALPPGSGIVFRHYRLDPVARQKLFMQVRRVARRRGHMLLLAGDEALARQWHADGFHSKGARRKSAKLVHSVSVHDQREIAAANRSGADLLFLSPLFATSSHPGASPLGCHRFVELARLAGDTPVIALGGMTKAKAVILDKSRTHGWAAIDAFRI